MVKDIKVVIHVPKKVLITGLSHSNYLAVIIKALETLDGGFIYAWILFIRSLSPSSVSNALMIAAR
jgi:hypothetical protein